MMKASAAVTVLGNAVVVVIVFVAPVYAEIARTTPTLAPVENTTRPFTYVLSVADNPVPVAVNTELEVTTFTVAGTLCAYPDTVTPPTTLGTLETNPVAL